MARALQTSRAMPRRLPGQLQRILTLSTLSVVSFGCAAPTEEADLSSEEQGDELVSDPPGSAARGSLLPPEYESLSAAAKQEILWKMVSADEYCTDAESEETAIDYASSPGCLEKLPKGGGGYGLQALKSVLSLRTTFDRKSDELPKGRHKLFHPFGSVAKGEFIASDNPYSGMFANTGRPTPILIRLAPAGGASFVPGVALKFFAAGRPSVNTVAIESFEGQGDDLNYFHAVPSNVIPWPSGVALRLVANFFKLVKSEPNHLQLTNIAAVSADGSEPETTREPYQIQFRPHGGIATTYGEEAKRAGSQIDFRAVLRRIPAGSTLYDVYARPSEDDTSYTKIGEIRTTSALVASGRGDYQLFFRHHHGTN